MFRPSRVPNNIAPVRFAHGHHGRANWLHCSARLSRVSGPLIREAFLSWRAAAVCAVDGCRSNRDAQAAGRSYSGSAPHAGSPNRGVKVLVHSCRASSRSHHAAQRWTVVGHNPRAQGRPSYVLGILQELEVPCARGCDAEHREEVKCSPLAPLGRSRRDHRSWQRERRGATCASPPQIV